MSNEIAPQKAETKLEIDKSAPASKPDSKGKKRVGAFYLGNGFCCCFLLFQQSGCYHFF